MSTETELTDDTLHYIACELSHDLRCLENGEERIRWNNRCVKMLVEALAAEKDENARLAFERDSLKTALARQSATLNGFAKANTALRKILSMVPANIAIAAKEAAGFGNEVHAQFNDPKADEAWLEFVQAGQAPARCGHVGGTRDGKITAVCTLPSGHAGNHGGMGCEW